MGEHESDLVVGAHLAEQGRAEDHVRAAVVALGLEGIGGQLRVGVQRDAEVAARRWGGGVLLAAEGLGRGLDPGDDAGEVGGGAGGAGARPSTAARRRFRPGAARLEGHSWHRARAARSNGRKKRRRTSSGSSEGVGGDVGILPEVVASHDRATE